MSIVEWGEVRIDPCSGNQHEREKAYSDNWLKDLVDEEDLFEYRTDEEYQEDYETTTESTARQTDHGLREWLDSIH